MFRLAIIGCGRIAARHLEASLEGSRVEVTALVDPVESHARSLAGRFGISPRIAEDVRDVVDDVDGAVIATPNHLHAGPAIECLNAGVPVLIEKPLAVSVAEGERICRVSEERGIVAAVGYVTRFGDNVRQMRSLLESEYFGKVLRFAYQTGSRGGWAPLSGYNLDRSATGGGVLVVTGTHFLDRMLYWFGYPSGATLEHDSLGGPEANAFAGFEYENNLGRFQGTARFSKTVKLPTGFVMETEAGTVLLGEGPEEKIRLRPHDRPDLELTLSDRETTSTNGKDDTLGLFQRQLEDFASAVQQGHEPMVAARDGLQSLRLLEELYGNATLMSEDWYSQKAPTVNEELAVR